MKCTVRELLARIGSDELSEWLAYSQLEPLTDSWQQTGQICATFVNVMADPKKKYEPADFIPTRKPSRPKRQKTPGQDQAFMAAFAAAHNQRIAAKE